MLPTLLQSNTNHLTISQPWFNHLRQRARETLNSNKVHELFRPPRGVTNQSRFYSRDKQGTPRPGSRVSRVVLRQTRPRTRESHRIAREGGQLHHRERKNARQVFSISTILRWYAFCRADRLVLYLSPCVTPADAPKEQTRATLLDFIKSVRSALAALGENL